MRLANFCDGETVQLSGLVSAATAQLGRCSGEVVPEYNVDEASFMTLRFGSHRLTKKTGLTFRKPAKKYHVLSQLHLAKYSETHLY